MPSVAGSFHSLSPTLSLRPIPIHFPLSGTFRQPYDWHLNVPFQRMCNATLNCFRKCATSCKFHKIHMTKDGLLFVSHYLDKLVFCHGKPVANCCCIWTQCSIRKCFFRSLHRVALFPFSVVSHAFELFVRFIVLWNINYPDTVWQILMLNELKCRFVSLKIWLNCKHFK